MVLRMIQETRCVAFGRDCWIGRQGNSRWHRIEERVVEASWNVSGGLGLSDRRSA